MAKIFWGRMSIYELVFAEVVTQQKRKALRDDHNGYIITLIT